MAKESIRIVIRQPLHKLIKEWADVLGVDDFGEVVNFLLLDLKRTGYLPNSQSTVNTTSHQKQDIKPDTYDDASELAGLF
ncbi:hypothetical protein DSM106972_097440 [Dulcicalothrix desertica PCC 7102]|uniref:Uncharacterized protein n=1 Tax=Dulcicalothrix desertica PCC 7102 TaxID=232991 RepID=A0A3S1I747_9CYAN|nr:hypothetical protein [Dulcicalothrix desertica]RUS93112.1 hypothetical protein DSM106972_097440 [Dulcicalothrix desertica PCC 7102]